MLAHTFTAFTDKYGVSVAYATIPDKNISQEQALAFTII
jgi:hypothetical protein